MFRYYKIFMFLLLALATSCDSMKSISSKYNILYNGDLFLNEAIDQLRGSYKDDFWNNIPVIIDNNITNSLPEYPSKNFLKSEEKAIKVIQKMGNSRNSTSEYINDAYLLLGKSRFYDKRYLSSLQAFNYILKQEIKSNIWFEAFYWRILIYINLEQFDLAESSLKTLLKSNKISDKNLFRLYESMSELYYKKGDYALLIKSLKKAIKYSNNQEQIRRSYYIIAQSFANLNKKDSASIHFNKSINVNTNKFQEIYLDANLKLSLLKTEDVEDEYFIKMLKQPRNFASKAKIKYYFAQNYLNTGNLKNSENQFKLALNLIENDETLKLKIYEQLFEINLNQKKYLKARNYLDTLITSLDKNTKKFFTLNKKRKKLNSIADLEKQNELIDSLLYLSTLDSNKLKDLLVQSQNTNEIKKDKQVSIKKTLGAFYFNNRSAIENGKKQFNRLWGSRNRIDNWRLKAQNNIIAKNRNISNDLEQDKLEPVVLDIKSIPYQKLQKDSLSRIKNSNHFKKGIYLYEYFNDIDNSEKSLLKVSPEMVSENDFIQSRYYLYKIYSSSKFENLEKSQEYKNLIVNNHPTSIYAKILNTNTSIIDNELNVKDYLDNIILKNDKKDINRIVSEIDSILPTVSSRSDLFQLYLQKYEIQAKTEGLKVYLKSLNELVELFPERQVELNEKMEFLKKVLSKKSLSIVDGSFVLFFAVNKNEKIKGLMDFEYKIDNYDSITNFISIYGYSSRMEAELTLQEIIKKNKVLSNNKYFVISTPQYINILVFKTLDELKG